MKSTITARGRRRTLRAIAVAGAMTGVAVGVSVGSADADVAGQFKVCAYGNYAAYVQIPQQGGIQSFIAPQGTCTEVSIAPGTTYGNVYGIWNTDPDQSFYIGTVGLDAGTGYTAAAEGTTTSPYLVHLG